MKTRERLVDLVFNELDPEARRRALVEIENCPGCLAQYRSMTETLRVFDQASEIATPDEGYWPGYEARLRERLRLEGPSLKRRLERWIGGFWPLTASPLQLGAGLALVLLAIGWWSWRQRQAVGTSPIDNQVATATPTPQTKVESLDKDIAAGPKTEVIIRKQKPIYPKTVKSDGEAPPVRRDEQGVDIVKHDVVSRGLDQSLIAASLFTPETIRHFEKAQLMLRSFRNVGVGKASRIRAPIDLDYEKQLSRRLLYQNILLRRDAEMKGDLPAEEALSNLEPFLLDIANLPDKPSADELRGIRERLQRKELIASLQISSARPSAPAYQNP
ncbi:MAG TPA: hypothetical protein VJ810_23265 [Blastocatellia bacterium]|nr:hypothetical protein [Blastocatellia bacterium]